MVKINISYPPYGSKDLIDIDEEEKWKVFLEEKFNIDLQLKALKCYFKQVKPAAPHMLMFRPAWHKKNPLFSKSQEVELTTTSTPLPKAMFSAKEKRIEKSQKQRHNLFEKQKAKKNQRHKNTDNHLGRQYGR